jgi:hypothetical protein
MVGIRPHCFIFIMKALIIPLLFVSLTACQREEVTNKTTCLQAEQAIENASYQMDIIDKRIILSSDDTAKVIANAQKKELELATKMFERILKDPELNCSQYLE